MHIHTDSWHYRLYAYWLRLSGGNKPGYQENLCHYMRVLVLWAPARWVRESEAHIPNRVIGLLLVSPLAFVLGLIAFTYPRLFITSVLYLASGMVAGVAVVITAYALRAMYRSRVLKIPGTVRLLAAYAVAKKRRICPFITFEVDS